MTDQRITRRRFLESTAVVSGALIVGDRLLAAEPAKRPTAVDQVKLGKTGLRICRLGMGFGSVGGSVQRSLGQDGLTRLIRYGYERGVRYIDTAESYRTHEMIAAAIKGLPRETLFIQTKMPGNPEKPLEVLDRYRRELGVEYIDSVLTHCVVRHDWDDERRRVLDALEEAKARKIIRAHGMSCHSVPALKRSGEIDWVDVHLVRINPQGVNMDTPAERWNAKSDASHVPAVVEQLKVLHAKKRGVIGMKIMGEGAFTSPEDREKSIRFAMRCPGLSAIVIGFKSTAEIDEAIERMNRALAELPDAAEAAEATEAA